MTITVEEIFDFPQPKRGEILRYCVRALPDLGFSEKDILYKMMSATERATGKPAYTSLSQILDSDDVYMAAFKYQIAINEALASGELTLPK